MNVYFVNKYSKLKGPFDIIDSSRQHIIKVGDICLRDTNEGVAFLVVYSSINTWNACKLVGIGRNDDLSDIGNTLLFSFDGLSRRKGNITLIKQITLCFKEKVIDDFLRNAVDILEYKKDFWDGSLFPQFFASSKELVDRDEQKKSDENTNTSYYPSIFAEYLSKELLELLTTSLNEGKELKEAYQILRNKHPELFRKALMQFLIENPDGSIFEKPAEVFVPAVKEVEISKANFQNDWLFEADERIDDKPLWNNKRIDNFLREISREELLSIEDEVEIAFEIRKGDINARNKLVSANLRFVVGLVKETPYRGVDYEDLWQEGFLGLIRAAELFDETRGFKFISYASWWIKRYITNAIVNDSSLIRFPLNVRILHRKIWNFKLMYEQKNGFYPPTTDIEVEDGDDLERISFLDRLPANLKSTCISSENYDMFEDEYNDILEYENSDYNKVYVRSLLSRLSEREIDILTRFFGIGVEEETLESIGETYGLTRERVRQIKEKAIKKLREFILYSRIITQDDNEEEKTKEIELIIRERKRKEEVQKIIKRAEKSKVDSVIRHQKDEHNDISHVLREVDELDGIKVGDRIVYYGKNCTICKIIIREDSSLFQVKYDNEVLDYVVNEKSRYHKVLSYYHNSYRETIVNDEKRHDNKITSQIFSTNTEPSKRSLEKGENNNRVLNDKKDETEPHRTQKLTYLLYNSHKFWWKVGDFVALGNLFSGPITIQGDPYFLFRKNILFVFMKSKTANNRALTSNIYLLPADTHFFKMQLVKKYGRRMPRVLFFVYNSITSVQFLDEVQIRRIDANFIRFESIL